MARYIDADKIIKHLDSIKELSELEGKFNEWQYARYVVCSAETEDVTLIVHGKWIAQDIHNCHTDFKCSECGYIHNFMHLYGKPTADYTYCPNCGARMEESEEE